MIERQAALALLEKYDPEPFLLNHGKQTEAIMRALATELGQDADLWGITGLLHDVDFPRTRETPQEHGRMAQDILADLLPEEALYAIAAHNEEHTGVVAQSDFDFALRAAESATGLISAAALVRPTRMEGMKPKSLNKKMKDKAFAAAVSRDRIREAQKLGMEMAAFWTLAIAAMAETAHDTGLAHSNV